MQLPIPWNKCEICLSRPFQTKDNLVHLMTQPKHTVQSLSVPSDLVKSKHTVLLSAHRLPSLWIILMAETERTRAERRNPSWRPCHCAGEMRVIWPEFPLTSPLFRASEVKRGLRVNGVITGSMVMFNPSKCCPSIMAVSTCAMHKYVT